MAKRSGSKARHVTNHPIGDHPAPRTLSRAESKLVTRNRLLQAGLSLLAEQGYERLTTGHVARRAGVAQPTFYVHFSDKDDLLQAIAIDAVGKMRTALRQLRLQLTGNVPDLRVVPLPDLFAVARQAYRLPLELLAGKQGDVLRFFVSELHRPRSKMGQSARELLAELTRDLVEDLGAVAVTSAVPAATLELVCEAVVMLTIQLAMAHVEGRRRDLDALTDLLARTTVHLLVDAAGTATPKR
ncbi:MAG: TetR/AcrR family transcriptional regulator [Polyangiales bacterium]